MIWLKFQCSKPHGIALLVAVLTSCNTEYIDGSLAWEVSSPLANEQVKSAGTRWAGSCQDTYPLLHPPLSSLHCSLHGLRRRGEAFSRLGGTGTEKGLAPPCGRQGVLWGGPWKPQEGLRTDRVLVLGEHGEHVSQRGGLAGDMQMRQEGPQRGC